MIEISGDECFNKLDEQGYLVYYFTASWCKPCQRILGDIIKLSEDDNYNVSFYKIEITDEDNNEICEKCGIKSVPSFLLFKDRTYIDRLKCTKTYVADDETIRRRQQLQAPTSLTAFSVEELFSTKVQSLGTKTESPFFFP